MVETSKKLDFWNSRADLGEIAGTNDFPLKDLELNLIHEKIAPGSAVLDVGCGNGDTLMSLAMNKDCSGVGVDFSEKMIELAQTNCLTAGRDAEVKFLRGAIPGLPVDLGEFDYALTERCLINLDGEASQRQAFLEIMSHVKPGGYFLMIESSVQGLERTNELRQMLDLEKIDPPWHNVFLDETSVPNWATCEFSLEEVIPFSSTYHFLSRVVYARLAADKGEPLRYDSDINMLACRLPIVGNFGPARLWLWHRK
jgi:ubiquinone/menaquinone biosynthesis C-methylase UbiE